LHAARVIRVLDVQRSCSVLWTVLLLALHPVCGGSKRRNGRCEKLVDDLREFPCTRPQSQVSVVEDVELRVRDQAMHDLRVDQGDKRVVIPMQNQCRLPEFAEPEDTGPTHCPQHLIEVAERATKVCGLRELVR